MIRITIKAARVNKGLSQKDAAELIGVSSKTLGLYESGKKFPRVNIVETMGKVYGIDKEAFIFLENNAKSV